MCARQAVCLVSRAGVVRLSMFSPHHLRSPNLRRDHSTPEVLDLRRPVARVHLRKAGSRLVEKLAGATSIGTNEKARAREERLRILENVPIRERDVGRTHHRVEPLVAGQGLTELASSNDLLPWVG